jgi:hypothetical protein
MSTKLKKNFSLRKLIFHDTEVTIEEQLIKDELALVSSTKHLKFYHASLSKELAEAQLGNYFRKRGSQA